MPCKNTVKKFQLTTSRRGRPKFCWHLKYFNLFQLTTSRRGRRPKFLNRWKMVISTHDLTKRSTCFCVQGLEDWIYFNSRPHEEVDDKHSTPVIFFNISTHDLTKRSTNSSPRFVWAKTFQLTTSRRGRLHRIFDICLTDISTHDLTKRSTFSLFPS